MTDPVPNHRIDPSNAYGWLIEEMDRADNDNATQPPLENSGGEMGWQDDEELEPERSPSPPETFFASILAGTCLRRGFNICCYPFRKLIRIVEPSNFLHYHTLFLFENLCVYSIGTMLLFLAWELMTEMTRSMFANGDGMTLDAVDQLLTSIVYTAYYAIWLLFLAAIPMISNWKNFTLIVHVGSFLMGRLTILREDELLMASPMIYDWRVYGGYAMGFLVLSLVMLPGSVGAWLAIPEAQQVLLTPGVVSTVYAMSRVSTAPLIAILIQVQNMLWTDNVVVPYRYRWPQEYYVNESFGGWKPIVQENYWWNAILGFSLLLGGAFWCLKTDPTLSPYQDFQVMSAGFKQAAVLACVEATVLLLCPFNLFHEEQLLTSLIFSLGLTVTLFGGVAVVGVVYAVHNQETEAPMEITVTNQTKFFSNYFLQITAVCLATSWVTTFDLYIDSQAPMPTMAAPNEGNPQLRFFLKAFFYTALSAALFYLAMKISELKRHMADSWPILEVMEQQPYLIPNYEDAINEAQETREAIQRRKEMLANDDPSTPGTVTEWRTPQGSDIDDTGGAYGFLVQDNGIETLETPLLES